jgi:hypothetical protein
MAIVKGVNKTKIDAGGSGTNVIPQAEFAGTVKSVYDTYEATAIASGDTIEVATPPPESKIVGITLSTDDLGTGCTLAVGDSNTADLYITATSAADALTTSAINVGGMNYEIGTTDGDEEILITVAGSAITGTIKIEIFYV